MILNPESQTSFFSLKQLGRHKWLIGFCVFFLLLLSPLVFVPKQDLQKQVRGFYQIVYFHVARRYQERDADTDWIAMLGNTMLASLKAKTVYYFLDDRAPHININIDFNSWQALKAERESMLGKKFQESEKQYYKATIQHNGKVIPIKMRLKGEMRDHIDHPFKWSFRVKTRKGKSIFGMRRFSLQRPSTRSYQTEAIYQYLARKMGIISLRFMFVEVSINGERIGLMNLEEHFSKELLANNKKKEGLIYKFDKSVVNDFYHAVLLEKMESGAADSVDLYDLESLYVGPYKRLASVYYNSLNAPFHSLINFSKKETLTQQNRTAQGLLKAVRQGELLPSKVFDAEKMGHFFAYLAMWGDSHNASFRNMRYYFNPYTYLFEPIAYDSNTYSSKRLALKPNDETKRDHEFNRLLLTDPLILSAYTSHMLQFKSWANDEKNIDDLKEIEAPYLSRLRQEYWGLPEVYLESIPLTINENVALIENEMFYERTDELVNDIDDPAPLVMPEHFDAPRVVNAEYYLQDGHYKLELHNYFPLEVELAKLVIRVDALETNIGQEVLAASKVILPPFYYNTVVSNKIIDLGPIEVSKDLEVSGRLKLQTQASKSYEFVAQSGYPLLDKHPLQSQTVKDIVKRYPFVSFDQVSNQLLIKRGKWEIESMVLLPAGVGLNIEEGTEIRFAPKAGFIVRAAVQIKGSNKQPVLLTSLVEGELWSGFSVIGASAKSNLTYAKFENVSYARHKTWQLTGSVNFIESEVSLSHVDFEASDAEDFVNIVNTHFKMDRVSINGARSDGFDGDFVIGAINHSDFTSIGGDAIDFSGSEISVYKSNFTNVADKAISVGEETTLNARLAYIKNSSVGVAVKDGSMADIRHSKLYDIRHAAFMAYNKKNEYGVATLIVEDSLYEGSVLRQKGNILYIDSEPYPEVKADIDSLYKSGYMKK